MLYQPARLLSEFSKIIKNFEILQLPKQGGHSQRKRKELSTHFQK
jgi:hypothetical protein